MGAVASLCQTKLYSGACISLAREAHACRSACHDRVQVNCVGTCKLPMHPLINTCTASFMLLNLVGVVEIVAAGASSDPLGI